MTSDTLPQIAQALRLIAAALETQHAPLPAASLDSTPKYIDENELFARYGMKKSAADSRGIPRKRIGRKSQWLVADVERALAKAPIQTPRPPRKSRQLSGENIDPLDQMLAAGELVARRGAR